MMVVYLEWLLKQEQQLPEDGMKFSFPAQLL